MQLFLLPSRILIAAFSACNGTQPCTKYLISVHFLHELYLTTILSKDHISSVPTKE